MPKSIIAEGKTTTEAIEKGLKELKATKNMVDIKVLDNTEKRSFFSILAPKIVKVELTLKEEKKQESLNNSVSKKESHPENKITLEELEQAKKNLEEFLQKFIKNFSEEINYNITIANGIIEVNITGNNTGFLIGYRGETLYALQNILTAISNKGIENKVILRLDISNFKAKREKTLKQLAEKLAKTVLKTKKPITLEPMQAYERKIIHSTLQKYEKIETTSIGQEPHRKIVISLKKI